MHEVPPSYKRVARMTGAELLDHLRSPPEKENFHVLIRAEILLRLVDEIPRVGKKCP